MNFSTYESLTLAEARILRLVLAGLSSKEIAIRLHRSVRTVEVHRQHIMQKLDAHNLVQLVQTATRMGLNELQNT